MNTAVLMVPTLFPEHQRELFPESLNPDKSKQQLDAYLTEGFRIKLMNDFVFGQVLFTHYVLEKEVL